MANHAGPAADETDHGQFGSFGGGLGGDHGAGTMLSSVIGTLNTTTGKLVSSLREARNLIAQMRQDAEAIQRSIGGIGTAGSTTSGAKSSTSSSFGSMPARPGSGSTSAGVGFGGGANVIQGTAVRVSDTRQLPPPQPPVVLGGRRSEPIGNAIAVRPAAVMTSTTATASASAGPAVSRPNGGGATITLPLLLGAGGGGGTPIVPPAAPAAAAAAGGGAAKAADDGNIATVFAGQQIGQQMAGALAGVVGSQRTFITADYSSTKSLFASGMTQTPQARLQSRQDLSTLTYGGARSGTDPYELQAIATGRGLTDGSPMYNNFLAASSATAQLTGGSLAQGGQAVGGLTDTSGYWQLRMRGIDPRNAKGNDRPAFAIMNDLYDRMGFTIQSPKSVMNSLRPGGAMAATVHQISGGNEQTEELLRQAALARATTGDKLPVFKGTPEAMRSQMDSWLKQLNLKGTAVQAEGDYNSAESNRISSYTEDSKAGYTGTLDQMENLSNALAKAGDGMHELFGGLSRLSGAIGGLNNSATGGMVGGMLSNAAGIWLGGKAFGAGSRKVSAWKAARAGGVPPVTSAAATAVAGEAAVVGGTAAAGAAAAPAAGAAAAAAAPAAGAAAAAAPAAVGGTGSVTPIVPPMAGRSSALPLATAPAGRQP